jgi:small ligand-binding sensory domain FIST
MTSRSEPLGMRTLLAGGGLGLGAEWRTALGVALDSATTSLDGAQPDLLVLFASAAYGEHYGALLAEAKMRTDAREVIGCSASGVIGLNREVEDQAGIVALALRLPPRSLIGVRRVRAEATGQSPVDLEMVSASELDAQATDLANRAPTGLLVLADPFTMDVDALITRLEQRYQKVPIMGGLATSLPGWRHTFLFHGTDVLEEGALVIGLGGATKLTPVVSQGCEPIGQAWTITDATGHIVKAIGGRPAYDVLAETVRGLDDERRARVNGNLLVGLAMDEYRDEFGRGDFLIRQFLGVDPRSGAIGIGAQVQVGQTLQFQIRDAQAADEELRHMLALTHQAKGLTSAALLFACNGRGVGLFGAPDHDARVVRDLLGPLPVAGLFCNGEIGPVGSRTFLHGFTASLALIGAAD